MLRPVAMLLLDELKSKCAVKTQRLFNVGGTKDNQP